MEFDDSLSTSMGDFGESTQDLEIPESLPMMAVRDVVVFNYMIIPLFVGRPGSIEAVNEGLSKNTLPMLVTQKDPAKPDPEAKDLYSVGTVYYTHLRAHETSRKLVCRLVLDKNNTDA